MNRKCCVGQYGLSKILFPQNSPVGRDSLATADATADDDDDPPAHELKMEGKKCFTHLRNWFLL